MHVIIRFQMDDLLDLVRRYAERYALWSDGESLVVGVSGGPDSLCLLHLLRRLAPEHHLTLHVAHLNHGLRGAEAEADAKAVAELAEGWGLPYTIGRADVPLLAAETRASIEEAARQARYDFLQTVARVAGATTIAVGHNADDQAETVLMHFLRGSGLAGLRGMLPRSALGQGFLIRPLLETPRARVEVYCAAQGLQPRRDLSNADTTIYRNRLRQELLPLLEGYNPAIRRVLGHTAGVLAGDHEVVEQALGFSWQSILLPASAGPVVAGERGLPRDEVRFALVAWRALPLGLQRATLRRAIYVLRRHLRNINWEHVERAVWLARDGATGQEATLSAGLVMQIGYTALRVGAEGSAWREDLPQVAGSLPLHAPGITGLGGGWQAHVRLLAVEELPAGWDGGREGAQGGARDPWLAYLDAAAVGPEPVLRRRQAGERFRPLGLGGHSVKISEFMTNVKAPRAARSAWPLLAGRSGVAWVCGLRVDEDTAVGPGTHSVWEVRIYPEGRHTTVFDSAMADFHP
jgi:tRNA(Ile)-lysidine synthase